MFPLSGRASVCIRSSNGTPGRASSISWRADRGPALRRAVGAGEPGEPFNSSSSAHVSVYGR